MLPNAYHTQHPGARQLARQDYGGGCDPNDLRSADVKRQAVRELATPVIPITATTAILPLIGDLEAQRLHDLQSRALQTIEHTGTRSLVLNIMGVTVVDTEVAQGLMRVVQAGALLGAQVVLVGIRPEVAQAIVGLGVDLRGVRTFSSLQSALQVVV